MTTTSTTTPESAPQRPSVLFVCVHNAGRSQMAAGFLRELAGDSVVVHSGGTEPAETINPVAVEAMGEIGRAVNVRGVTVTKGAKAAIEAAGGSVEA